MVLFILLYKVCCTSVRSLKKNIWCDHSNENFRAVLSSGTVCCVVQVVLTFNSVHKI